jgi:hypothetical protein
MYTSMFRKAMLGDTATLNLDFTTGTLDSRLTFTRSGTGTYINSSGYVTTASTNVARFDYDPATLAPRGLLLEGQATNLTTRSEDFAHAEWTKDNSGGLAPVVTTVSATTPANGSTVNQIVFNKTGGVFSRVSRSSVGTASTAYTMSVWMRTVSGTANVGLRIGADAAGFNCAVTTTWKRFQYTYTLSSTDSSAQIMLWDNIVGNDETATVYVWGCQVELGTGASSYIPTTASQVTRNADSCVMTGTNFTSWYTQGIGTVSWSGSVFRTTAGHLANINTVNNDPRITAYVGAGSLTNLVTNVTTQASISFGTVTANTAFKAAWRFNTNDFAACLNAGTVGTDTSGTVPTGVDRIQFGAAEGGYQFLDGWIKSFKYYPTAFTNAQLQAITTL